MKQGFKGGFIANDGGREPINEINGGFEIKRPKRQRKGGTMEESKPGLDNVSMTTLSGSNVLWGVRRGNKVLDAMGFKNRLETLLFFTTIRINGFNGGVKIFFDHSFEFWENYESFRFGRQGE